MANNTCYFILNFVPKGQYLNNPIQGRRPQCGVKEVQYNYLLHLSHVPKGQYLNNPIQGRRPQCGVKKAQHS